MIRRSIAGVASLPAALVYVYYTTAIPERLPAAFQFLIWGCLAVAAARLATYLHLRRGGRITGWKRRLFLASVYGSGAIWGLTAEWVRQMDGIAGMDCRMFFLCVLVLSASAVTSFFSDLRATYGFLILAFGPVLAGSVIYRSAEGMVLSGAIVAFALFLVLQARRLHIEYWRAQENNELLAKRAIELQSARAAAEESNRSKSAFLACMSHEIRTPINGVLGMLSLALDSKLSADQRDTILTARQSAESLLRIVNDILDFSKIEAGRLDLDREPFSLNDLLANVEKTFAPMMALRGLEWSVESPELPGLQGDEGRLRQVLVNLIGNAMRFTESGRVQVRVAVTDRRSQSITLHLAVQDTGIGIAPEVIESIFEPFEQVDSSNRRRAGGTGLGLSISRRLVSLMDGRLWAESTPGEGSTFHLLVAFPLAEVVERKSVEPASIALDRLRVLVVEDNPVNEKVFTTLLSRRGADVKVARDGHEAVGQFIDHEFDLILMDVQMPRMDGLEATAAIRAREKGLARRTPIIAMTAGALNEDRELCLRAGMDAYMAKPILPDAFFQTITTVLADPRFAPRSTAEPVSTPS